MSEYTPLNEEFRVEFGGNLYSRYTYRTQEEYGKDLEAEVWTGTLDHRDSPLSRLAEVRRVLHTVLAGKDE